MSLTPLTPLPPLLEKYIFFALPSMNGPLPAELKFRENTDTAFRFQNICVTGSQIKTKPKQILVPHKNKYQQSRSAQSTPPKLVV